jgi:hypothetical protein
VEPMIMSCVAAAVGAGPRTRGPRPGPLACRPGAAGAAPGPSRQFDVKVRPMSAPWQLSWFVARLGIEMDVPVAGNTDVPCATS